MLFVVLLHVEVRSLLHNFYMLNITWSLLPSGMVIWLLVGGPVFGLLASGLSVSRYLRI
jgi:hypothetical protein